MTVIFAIVVLAGLYWLWHAASTRQAQQEENLVELQYFHPESVAEDAPSLSVHFPSMVMEVYLGCEPGECAHVEVYELRRNQNGTWECRVSQASFDARYRRAKAVVDQNPYPDREDDYVPVYVAHYREELKRMKEGRQWEPLDRPALETAYQRFIHSPPAPIVPPDWRNSEAKYIAMLDKKIGEGNPL